MSGPAPVLRLDERGKRCPLPVISLAARIVEVAVGQVVEVLADDPAAVHDIPAWCRMRGHEHLALETMGVDQRHLVARRS